MEESVRIPAGDLTLEGRLARAAGEKAAVVTHPHPLYGGDMNNNVVEALAVGYARAGFTTLRFNFRGVGRSEGSYDNGQGEMEDVRHAVALLAESGARSIHLAGYSFGAWVNARALDRIPDIREAVMVSPPAGFMDFSFVRPEPRVRLVITGARDEIAEPSLVAQLVPRWNPEAVLHVIQEADHFYFGHTEALRSVLATHLGVRGE